MGDNGGDNDTERPPFKPTPEQVQIARHLGHRLELARTVSAGIQEKIADLRQQLDAQAREVGAVLLPQTLPTPALSSCHQTTPPQQHPATTVPKT